MGKSKLLGRLAVQMKEKTGRACPSAPDKASGPGITQLALPPEACLAGEAPSPLARRPAGLTLGQLDPEPLLHRTSFSSSCLPVVPGFIGARLHETKHCEAGRGSPERPSLLPATPSLPCQPRFAVLSLDNKPEFLALQNPLVPAKGCPLPPRRGPSSSCHTCSQKYSSSHGLGLMVWPSELNSFGKKVQRLPALTSLLAVDGYFAETS